MCGNIDMEHNYLCLFLNKQHSENYMRICTTALPNCEYLIA